MSEIIKPINKNGGIQQPEKNPFNQVKNVIAVMSGKGGVGKSTVSALTAVNLVKKGKLVGILDADITGPSIPKMFGIHRRALANENIGIWPVRSRMGIEIISMNFFLEDEASPVIWRGPLIANTVKQLWNDIAWGDLDYLIVDLPPGTGDVPLTVMQSLPVKGIIMVTSPQELVGLIVKKAIHMAETMQVPILGIIENMSYVTCPHCGEKFELFGKSSVADAAAEMGLKYLGALPLDRELVKLCDEGKVENYSSGTDMVFTSWLEE